MIALITGMINWKCYIFLFIYVCKLSTYLQKFQFQSTKSHFSASPLLLGTYKCCFTLYHLFINNNTGEHEALTVQLVHFTNTASCSTKNISFVN